MSGAIDPITLQVLAGGLRAACDEMGAALIRSAYSANIKERRDCSTALFDARGELVMQAEHIPVHLGSMPDAVAAVLDEEQRPGESWILNDPYRGGTHLPDITLVTPVFVRGEPFGLRRQPRPPCRRRRPDPGQHAGRLDDPRRGGRGDPADAGRHAPAARDRRPDALSREQRLADLRAQRAANRIGTLRLGELAERHGLTLLRAGMDEILDYAERRTRAALAELPDGTYAAEDLLEDDAGDVPDAVALRVEATISASASASTSPAPTRRSRATSTARSR